MKHTLALLAALGAKCEFVHGGSPNRKTRTVIAYLFQVLADNDNSNTIRR